MSKKAEKQATSKRQIVKKVAKKSVDVVTETNRQPHVYDLFLCVAGVLTIALIAWHFTLDPESETAVLIDYFDNFICLFFFIDFVRNLWMAPNKKKYIMGWGILDLLASIPTVEALRFTRVPRIFRVLRILRMAKSFRGVLEAARRDRRSAALTMVLTVTIVGVVGSTFMVMHYESQSQNPEVTLTNASDTLWWAISTVTTGGSENLDPLTPGGRFGGVILKLIGITVFATLAGVVADLLRALAAEKQKD